MRFQHNISKNTTEKGRKGMSITQLSHGIDITEMKSRYDTEAKYLISNKQVLARIMIFAFLR